MIIQQSINAMMAMLLAKFVLNDVPHAAGLYSSFDPGKYKDIETLFYGMKDLTYGDTLKWVEFWYPSTMPEGAMRFTATTIRALHSMWREGLVEVKGDNIIMR